MHEALAPRQYEEVGRKTSAGAVPSQAHLAACIQRNRQGRGRREGPTGNLGGASPGAGARGRQVPHELMACRLNVALGEQILFQGQSAKGFPERGDALRICATFLFRLSCLNRRRRHERMCVTAYGTLQRAGQRVGGDSATMPTSWADDYGQCHGAPLKEKVCHPLT